MIAKFYLNQILFIVSNQSIAIVTALFDIGRGEWWEYRRPFDEYLKYLQILLQLKNNLIIYIDNKSIEWVMNTRRKFVDDDNRTLIIPFGINQLPLWRYRNRMQSIIDNEQINWNVEWDTAMRTHPESKSADYNIIVNSKPFFIYDASQRNPFESTHFVWLDAGYGHGRHNIYPVDWIWSPQLPSHAIALIKLTPDWDMLSKYQLKKLYRHDVAVISGGFVSVPIALADLFYRIFWSILIDMIDQSMIDDDQTILVMLAQREPAIFHITHGDWFDAFKLYPSQL